MTGGLPTGATTGGLPTGATTGGLPTGAVTGGLPTGAVTGGLPTGATTGGLPTGAVTGGLPTGATTGGLPTGAETGGLPTGAVTGVPPTGATTGGPPTGAASDNVAERSKSPRPDAPPTVLMVPFKLRLPPRICKVKHKCRNPRNVVSENRNEIRQMMICCWHLESTKLTVLVRPRLRVSSAATME